MSSPLNEIFSPFFLAQAHKEQIFQAPSPIQETAAKNKLYIPLGQNRGLAGRIIEDDPFYWVEVIGFVLI